MGLTKVGVKGLDDGTDGQIITYDANGNPVAVGPGTDGQVLTSTGAGSPPAFEDAAGGAALTGSTNNTITTVTGANAIQGEANLTFDGNDLTQTITSSGGQTLTSTGNHAIRITANTDRAAENNTLLALRAQWNDTQVAMIDFQAGDDTTNKDNSKIAFYTAPAGTQEQHMLIESNGNVKINDGDLVIGTNGHGIDFSAQTASSATGASATGELLDHYEEGTWTPVLTSGFTYQTLSASYTRIGNVVHVYFNLYRNDSGTYSSVIDVSGVPFAIASTSSPFTNSMGLGIAASYNGASDRRIGFINANNADSVRIIKAGTTAHVSYDDFVVNSRAFTMKWWYYTA
mgnify:CR=1 FL=1